MASVGKGQDAALRTYFQSKIDSLEQQVRAKLQNLRRLEAQRNELNAKGASRRCGRGRASARRGPRCR